MANKQYALGINVQVNYNPEEIKKTLNSIQNQANQTKINLTNIKIDGSVLNNLKGQLEKTKVTLGNISFDLSKLKINNIDLKLNISRAEMQKVKDLIQGINPVVQVKVSGQGNTGGSGVGLGNTIPQTIIDNEIASLSKLGTVIKYSTDEFGKLTIQMKTAEQEVKTFSYQWDSAQKSLYSNNIKRDNPTLLIDTEKLKNTIPEIKKIVDQFNVLKAEMSTTGKPIDFGTQKLIPDLEMLNTRVKTLNNGMQNITQTYKLNEKQSMSISGQYNVMKGSMDNLSTSTGNLINRQLSFNESLAVAMEKFPIWMLATTAYIQGIQKMGDAFTFMFEQSKLFTNLQMEMTNTKLDFGQITGQANQYATSMNSTTDSVMKAISVFGTYTSTMDEVLKKSQAAIIMSNLTGNSIEKTADDLMGTMAQFNLNAESSMHVVDVIAGTARMLQVDYPKAIEEISSGLRTVGSVAKESKVPLEQLSAMIGTLTEKNRRTGAENANALRTIFGRILNVGEDADPEAFKKVEKQLDNLGIKIREIGNPQSLRPVGDILADLAKQWNTLNDTQRQSIAFDAAGMYRKTTFITLMENYNEVLKNTAVAQNSDGVAMQKQEIFAKSLQASLNGLTTTWEKLYLDTINNNFSISIVGLAKDIVYLIDKIGAFNSSIIILNLGLAMFGKMDVVNRFFIGLAKSISTATFSLDALKLSLKTFWPLLLIGTIWAAVTAFDALHVSVEKQKEIVSAMTKEYGDLKTKVENLKNIKNPTENQKVALDLLKEELVVKKELLAIATTEQAKKDILGEGVLGDGIVGRSKDAITQAKEYGQAIQNNINNIKRWKAEEAKTGSNNLVSQPGYKLAISGLSDYRQALRETEATLLAQREKLQNYVDLMHDKVPDGTKQAITAIDAQIESIKKNIKNTDDLTGVTQQNTQAQKTNADAKKANSQTVDQQQKSAKQLDDAVKATSKSITELNKIQKELNTNHKLSAANMTIIAQKYPELLKYAGDEKKLKEELTKKVAEETHAYKQAIIDKLFASQDFYNKVLNGNETLTQELKRAYGNDLGNFQTFNNMKIQANSLLLNALGQQWSQYYATQAQALQALVNAPLNYNLTKDLGMSSVIGGQKVLNSPEIQAQLQAQQNLRQQQANQAKALLDGMNAASKAAAKTTGAIKLRSGNDTKAKKPKKPKAPASQSAPKAEPTALLDKDRYAQLNMELERTDTLLGKVKAEQEMYKDDDTQQKQYLATLDQEQKLLEKKQENLHNINNEYRIERAELEKKLSKKGIAFSGSGDTAYINNLSDDTDKLLNQVRKHQNDKNKTYYNQLNAEYASYLEKVKRFEEIQKSIGTNQQQFYSVEKDIKTLDQDREAIAQKQVKNSEQLLTDLKDSYNYQINKQQDSLDTQNKSWDAQISQYDAIVKLDETHYGLLNQVTSEQQAINDQLKTSKESYGYLNEETRKLLFNEDDYNTLSSKLTTIANDAGSLFTDYQSKISSLNEDNIYQLSQITNEFQRQYDLKMKEYDIAKKDLDTAKAKAELANVQNEHNVRLFQDGQWNWVADPKAVKDAMQKVSDAQVASTTAQSEYDQLVIEQKTQALADEIKLEEDGAKAKLDATVNAWKKISSEFEKPAKSIKDILADIAANGTPELKKIIADVSAALALLGIDLGITTATTQNNNSGSNSHPLDNTSWANNPSSSSGGGSGGTIQDQINDSLVGGHNFGSSGGSSSSGSSSNSNTGGQTTKAPGTISKGADGNTYQTRPDGNGGYKDYYISSHAEGTTDAPGGISLVGEKGMELINLPEHAQVFPTNITEKLMANLPRFNNITQPSNINNSKSIVVNVAKIVTNDAREFLSQLNNIVATHG